MGIKLLTAIATFALVATANAGEGSGTQYWYQPADGQNAFELGVSMVSQKPDPETYKLAGNLFNFDYYRGLNADMSLGAHIDFGTLEAEVTGITGKYKYAGMGDLTVKFLAKNDMSGTKLYYGADLLLGLGASKEASATVEGNRLNGGHKLTLNGGVAYPATSDLDVGAKLSYGIPFERTVSSASTPSTDTKKTGGSSWWLPLYGEYNFGSGNVGLYYALGGTGEVTNKAASGSESKTKASTDSGYGLWANYDINSEFTGILKYDSATAETDNSGTKTKVMVSTTTLAGRYSF